MAREQMESAETNGPLIHPYTIILSLVLAGVTMLFLALTISYMYSRIEGENPPIPLPIIFLFNTVILLASSGTLVWAKNSYRTDNTENYMKALTYTIILSIIFLGAQGYGWYQLFAQDLGLTSNNASSYLHIISITHFAHIIAGLPFLGHFLWTAKKRMKEPVSVLVYFSDPEKALRLKLLTWYWHFLDALWIYLVLFFWINYLIQ